MPQQSHSAGTQRHTEQVPLNSEIASLLILETIKILVACWASIGAQRDATVENSRRINWSGSVVSLDVQVERGTDTSCRSTLPEYIYSLKYYLTETQELLLYSDLIEA